MFRTMSYFAFILVVLFVVCPITLQQTLPPKAANPERIKLLKDALSWMTFRKNGQLATDQDLEPFFQVLKDRYLNSRYYKTMIIAFARGVLPKLTLKENDPCAPSYTLEYRDSFNNSVTDAQLKNFIIGSYDKREEASRQFCDYRKGLVCNKQTNKCECPPGSKMGLISQGNPEQRCLLQENEVCNLIDLDHDPSSDYGALKKYLPQMVFNLEKPMSCRMGTQCRFKSTNQITPLCYQINSGPSWDKGRWDIDLGEECTIGLYGDTGQCKIGPENDSVFNGYTCFNFGPRSQPKSPRVGLCAHDAGSYSNSLLLKGDPSDHLYWELQMIAFVSPATTPLRGKALYDYYFEYRKKLYTELSCEYLDYSSMTQNPGDRCNIDKTKKMLELWTFFKSLEDYKGKDYLATEADLQTKFKEAEDLTVNLKTKICQVFSEAFPNSRIDHALRCVRNSTDSFGNDGRCEEIPESEDVTLPWAKSFLRYRLRVTRTDYLLYREEKLYRKDIYEPDLECDPKLGPPPNSEGAAPSTDSFVLEGGYCPPDRACFVDYGDYQDIYHSNCSLKNAKPKLFLECQNLDDNRWHDRCETRHLDKLFDEELQTLSSYSGLQQGDACKYDLEVKLRDWMEKGGRRVKGNKYKRLIELYDFKNNNGGTTLCDRTRFLECSPSGTCECYSGTQPREVTLGAGMKYYSDHCYVASGDCSTEYSEPLRLIFEKSSQQEKNEINRHYSSREDQGRDCIASNWCVFTIEQSWRADCTTENTGTTGYLGEDPVTTTTTVRTTTTTAGRRTTVGRRTTTDKDDSKLVCQGEQCGWQEAGEAQKEIHVVFKIIILINVLTIIV